MVSFYLLFFLLPNYVFRNVVVIAWGPYAHEYFGGLVLNETATATTHLSSSSLAASYSYFLAGCTAPDAMKYISPELHTLEFSAVLYLYAAAYMTPYYFTNKKNHNQENRNDATMEEFALGYGCHIASDLVGHHLNGFIDPLHDHSLEFATDAYLYHQHQRRQQQMYQLRHTNQPSYNTLSFPNKLTDQEADMIYSASQTATTQYNISMHPNIVSQKQVRSAMHKFNAMETVEKQMMKFDLVYRTDMIKYSACKHSKRSSSSKSIPFENVIQDLQLSSDWIKQMCIHWNSEMINLRKLETGRIKKKREGTPWQRGDTSVNKNDEKEMYESIVTAVESMYTLVDLLFESNGGTSCAADIDHNVVPSPSLHASFS